MCRWRLPKGELRVDVTLSRPSTKFACKSVGFAKLSQRTLAELGEANMYTRRLHFQTAPALAWKAQRTVFLSDHHAYLRQAVVFNRTPEGRALLGRRWPG